MIYNSLFTRLSRFATLLCILYSQALADQRPPSNAALQLDASVKLFTSPSNRLLGSNLGLWYTKDELKALGDSNLFKSWKPGLLRMPGGSWSDEYFWNGNGVRKGKTLDASKLVNGQWQIDYSDYKPGFRVNHDKTLHNFHGHIDVKTLHTFIKSTGAEQMVSVNVGTGTPEMAAQWVKWANKDMGYNIKYWELGNELEGAWEAGHIRPDGSKMTAETYAKLAVEFAKAMKAADPSIKIGGPTAASDSIPFVEETIKIAGDHIDFITFHTYPVDGRLADTQKIFAETTRMETAIKKIRTLLETHQPARAKDIEIGITEWHIQVHETANTCNLLSGLWSARFIGEMMKSKIDFANHWDMFSTHGSGGHGVFQKELPLVPRASFWAFWLWSNHMGDTLVKSSITGNDNAVSFATIKNGKPAIMLINQDQDTPITINLGDLSAKYKTAKQTALSYENYVWNPFTKKPEWSRSPTSTTIKIADTITLPPFSATVLEFGETSTTATRASMSATPSILLPDSHPQDIPLDTLILLKDTATNTPSVSPQGTKVTIEIEGPLSSPMGEKWTLTQPAAHIKLVPTGSGKATIKLTAGDKSTTHTLDIKPVAFSPKVVWTFTDRDILKSAKSHVKKSITTEARRQQDVIELELNNVKPSQDNNYLLTFNPLAEHLKKTDIKQSEIAGITAWVKISDELQKSNPNATLQLVLQSEGNHWMLLKEIPFSKLSTVDLNDDKKQGDKLGNTVEVRIEDPALLKVMPQVYSIVILAKSPNKPLTGSIFIDDLGFILRKK